MSTEIKKYTEKTGEHVKEQSKQPQDPTKMLLEVKNKFAGNDMQFTKEEQDIFTAKIKKVEEKIKLLDALKSADKIKAKNDIIAVIKGLSKPIDQKKNLFENADKSLLLSSEYKRIRTLFLNTKDSQLLVSPHTQVKTASLQKIFIAELDTAMREVHKTLGKFKKDTTLGAPYATARNHLITILVKGNKLLTKNHTSTYEEYMHQAEKAFVFNMQNKGIKNINSDTKKGGLQEQKKNFIQEKFQPILTLGKNLRDNGSVDIKTAQDFAGYLDAVIIPQLGLTDKIHLTVTDATFQEFKKSGGDTFLQNVYKTLQSMKQWGFFTVRVEGKIRYPTVMNIKMEHGASMKFDKKASTLILGDKTKISQESITSALRSFQIQNYCATLSDRYGLKSLNFSTTDPKQLEKLYTELATGKVERLLRILRKVSGQDPKNINKKIDLQLLNLDLSMEKKGNSSPLRMENGVPHMSLFLGETNTTTMIDAIGSAYGAYKQKLPIEKRTELKKGEYIPSEGKLSGLDRQHFVAFPTNDNNVLNLNKGIPGLKKSDHFRQGVVNSFTEKGVAKIDTTPFKKISPAPFDTKKDFYTFSGKNPGRDMRILVPRGYVVVGIPKGAVLAANQTGNFMLKQIPKGLKNIEVRLQKGNHPYDLPPVGVDSQKFLGNFLKKPRFGHESGGNALSIANSIKTYILQNSVYGQISSAFKGYVGSRNYFEALEDRKFAENAFTDKQMVMDCDMANMYFVGLCRDAGIPARLVVGRAASGTGLLSGGHGWSEIWDGKQWVSFDATPSAPVPVSTVKTYANASEKKMYVTKKQDANLSA